MIKITNENEKREIETISIKEIFIKTPLYIDVGIR